MHRRLVALGGATLVTFTLASVSNAEVIAPQPTHGRTDDDSKSQLLGATLGAEVGGRVSPGGLRLAGSFLYRFTEIDWIDTGVGFTFGSGSANCFRDRSNDVVCDQGIASGFAADASVAIRRDLYLGGDFVPFFRAGVALRVIAYASDDVIGISLPLLGSIGVRARVNELLSVIALADLRVGWGIFNRGLGIEPQANASIGVGVEFDLD